MECWQYGSHLFKWEWCQQVGYIRWWNDSLLCRLVHTACELRQHLVTPTTKRWISTRRSYGVRSWCQFLKRQIINTQSKQVPQQLTLPLIAVHTFSTIFYRVVKVAYLCNHFNHALKWRFMTHRSFTYLLHYVQEFELNRPPLHVIGTFNTDLVVTYACWACELSLCQNCHTKLCNNDGPTRKQCIAPWCIYLTKPFTRCRGLTTTLQKTQSLQLCGVQTVHAIVEKQKSTVTSRWNQRQVTCLLVMLKSSETSTICYP